ncbi:MAG: hypothetical protein ACOVOX_12845, partial [Burkholderiaceae bacterium]
SSRHRDDPPPSVIPAQAGIQRLCRMAAACSWATTLDSRLGTPPRGNGGLIVCSDSPRPNTHAR